MEINKRNKICIWCKGPFYDETKRGLKRTCSSSCGKKLGVHIRQMNGSYKRTKEQNKKVSETIKNQYKTGKRKVSINKELTNPNRREEYNKKRRETCMKKYGVGHPMRSKKVLKNLKNTFRQKFGVDWATKSSKVKEKTKNTRIEKGLTYVFDNKTMKNWADDLGMSYTYFKQIVNIHSFDVAKKLSLNKTNLETSVEQILQDLQIKDFKYDFTGFKTYRPDFILPKEKIIIECDGLPWHCDRIVDDKNYHRNKLLFYNSLGYDSLFFRGDEIENKIEIIKSIIANKINKSKRVFARKLLVSKLSNEVAKNLLNSYHLMGAGKGETYALLDRNNVACCFMQVKWKNKKNKVLEISRFGSMLNTTVVGGFSKLVTFIEKEKKPKEIITFVDNRYGTGNYLPNLGFKLKGTNLSFKWTDGKKTFHRMRFKKNKGYEHGLYKIWDCGQSKFIKETNINE